MGGLSIWHWLIVLGVVLVLFGGGGKISGMMGDFAKGVKAFKKGLKDEDDDKAPPAPPAPPSQTIENPASPTMAKEKDHAGTV